MKNQGQGLDLIQIIIKIQDMKVKEIKIIKKIGIIMITKTPEIE